MPTHGRAAIPCGSREEVEEVRQDLLQRHHGEGERERREDARDRHGDEVSELDRHGTKLLQALVAVPRSASDWMSPVSRSDSSVASTPSTHFHSKALTTVIVCSVSVIFAAATFATDVVELTSGDRISGLTRMGRAS